MDEGRVVRRAVVRSHPRLAVVLTARGDRRVVEGVDRLAIGGGQREMRSLAHGLALHEPELRLLAFPYSRPPVEGGDDTVAQRLQSLLVELLALLGVADVERDV